MIDVWKIGVLQEEEETIHHCFLPRCFRVRIATFFCSLLQASNDLTGSWSVHLRRNLKRNGSCSDSVSPNCPTGCGCISYLIFVQQSKVTVLSQQAAWIVAYPDGIGDRHCIRKGACASSESCILDFGPNFWKQIQHGPLPNMLQLELCTILLL